MLTFPNLRMVFHLSPFPSLEFIDQVHRWHLGERQPMSKHRHSHGFYKPMVVQAQTNTHHWSHCIGCFRFIPNVHRKWIKTTHLEGPCCLTCFRLKLLKVHPATWKNWRFHSQIATPRRPIEGWQTLGSSSCGWDLPVANPTLNPSRIVHRDVGWFESNMFDTHAEE